MAKAEGLCAFGVTAGAVRSAGEKIGFKLITLSREPLAVWISLPTSDAYVFCAMTPFTGAENTP